MLRIAVAAACALLASGAAASPFSRGGAAAPVVPAVQLTPVPFMGWHPWYCCTYFIESDANIRLIAQSLIDTGLAAAGYNYLWLDSGWWGGARDGSGNIIPPPVQWPNGMASIATFIHSKGLKAGIYTDGGNAGCGFPPAGDPPPAGAWSGPPPGFIDKDTRQFLAWGFDAIRYDSCGLPGDMRPAYDAINATIAAIGIPVQYDVVDGGFSGLSAYGWDFASQYPNVSYRTGFDLGVTYPFQPAGPVSLRWSDFVGAVGTNYAHPGAAGPGHYNDPDLIAGYNCSNQVNSNVLTPPACLTADESQTAFTQWIIFAAPLLLSSDPRVLTAPQLAILKNAEAIAIAQDPLVVQGILVRNNVNLQTWSKVLSGVGNRAVMAVNMTGSVGTVTVPTSDLGLTGTAQFRDVFAGTNLGLFSSYTTPNLPAHASMLLHVTGGTENNANTVAVNVGGGIAGSFVADTNIGNDGTVVTTVSTCTAPAISPAPPAVYQSARVGVQSGSNYLKQSIETYIPNLVVDATYKVRLHFCEFQKSAAGQRKFNVKINNLTKLTDFDIYAAAGGANIGVIKEFLVPTPQGFVSVDLSRGSVDFPMISGVEVIKQ